MAKTWYRCFHRFCNWVYFTRVSVLHRERFPQTGPALYLGLHRNGAVDGFVYHAILPRADFMISTQLRQNLLGRLFFDGIEIVRSKDEGDPSLNETALKRCLALLRTGGELFVFPEGTSSLGPHHLPFKSGAARLLNDYLLGGGPITVVPLGIHYECPWSFRSNVEVVVGTPLAVDLSASLSPLGRLKELKRRIGTGLESVGINVESAAYQETIQRIAGVATLATDRSYFITLKSLESAIPGNIQNSWRTIVAEVSAAKLLEHQGIPLAPMGPVWWYGLVLLPLGLVVVAAVFLNLPPFVAGCWAGRKFPDDRNVISLWKIMVGVPVFGLWVLLLAIMTFITGSAAGFVVYAAVTIAGLKLYHRVKKLAVATHNGLRQPAFRSRMLAFRELVLREIRDEK